MTTTETPSGGEQSKRPLYRRSDDRVIGGVASGLSTYLDVQPLYVRIGFVLLATFGGAGIALYAALLFLMPDEDGHVRISIEKLRQHKGWVIAAVVLLAIVSLHDLSGFGILAGLGIAAIGAYLLLEQPTPTTAGATAGSTSTFTPGAAAGGATSVTTPSYGAGAQQGPQLWEPTGRTKPARKAKEFDALSLLTTGAVLLAVGASIALVQQDLVELTAQRILAIALLVIGLGFLIGTFIGRSGKLVGSAVSVSVLLVIASAMGGTFSTTTGDVRATPLTTTDLRSSYELGAGRNIVDLSQLVIDGPLPQRINVNTSAGFTIVIVPRTIATEVDATVGFGRLDVGNGFEGGIQKQRSVTYAGNGTTPGSLQINVHNGAGRVMVTDDPTIREARS